MKIAELHDILRTMVKTEASDLHLRVGCKPILRINNQLKVVANQSELTSGDTHTLADELFNDTQRVKYEEMREVDLSYNVEDIAGFRINVFQQRGMTNIVMRLVPAKVMGFEELNLPESLKKIASQNRGLVLVTGTTGCGKSTTLAAMIDYINRNFSKHIVTIEDPIEFLHNDIKSIISQRELGLDTFSYVGALRNVVRQDPDVIFIGEMRDMETMAAALTAAQMGHLVLSTIHTIAAMQTVSRIIDIFPPHQQNQIRIQLADSLCAVISQRLLPRKDKEGMIPAIEVLVATSLVRSFIEDNKISSIPEQMEKGDYYDMRTFNQSLEAIYREGKIELEEAKKAATNPEDLLLRIRGIKSSSGAGS